MKTILMKPYETRRLSGERLVRWYYDEHYETVGSYAYDTEEETKEAEDRELEQLRDGRLVALGAVAFIRCECNCPNCDGWKEMDSCWGIVVSPGIDSLDEWAEECLCFREI